MYNKKRPIVKNSNNTKKLNVTKISQDFLRTFSGHSQFGTDCLDLVILKNSTFKVNLTSSHSYILYSTQLNRERTKSYTAYSPQMPGIQHIFTLATVTLHIFTVTWPELHKNIQQLISSTWCQTFQEKFSSPPKLILDITIYSLELPANRWKPIITSADQISAELLELNLTNPFVYMTRDRRVSN